MTYFYIIGAVLALATASWTGWHERALREPAMLEAQKVADTKQCTDEKLITKEANDALQKDRDNIAAELRSHKLQHPNTCVPVAGQANASAGGPEHAVQNGISSDWLREYAAECETYRSEVIVCTKFIDDTWRENGQ